MRGLLAIALLVGLTAEAQGRFKRFSRCPQGRSDRGLLCDDYAFFEAAPASGAGMGAACACTAITGAKGEPITWSRTGSATCNKQGLATTGLADGDLVECGTDLPRVEPSSGVLGPEADTGATNVLLRFIATDNVLWANVGTPTGPTTGVTSPWTGARSTSAVTWGDDDALALEGRSQTVTVSAATQYTMSCWVKAGTATAATVSLDGTTASLTGLSSSTWRLLSVTDASSSGVAISAQVLVGSVVGDTGTITWGGCQVETGPIATPMIPTDAVAASRNEEGGSAAVALPGGAGCIAATFETRASTLVNGRLVLVWQDANNVFDTYIGTTNPTVNVIVGGASETTLTTAAAMPGGPFRVIATRVANTSRSVQLVGNAPTSAASALGTFSPTTIYLGRYGSTLTGFHPRGILTRIQVDPDTTRCAP